MRDGDFKMLARLTTAPARSPDITAERMAILKTAALTDFELYDLSQDVAEANDLAAGGGERFEALKAKLVEHYEDERYPMGAVTPQQAVAFMLEQKGLDRSNLDDVMGGKSRVSEFLSRKRELSKFQIEGLRRVLGIPADILLGMDA